MSKAKASGDSIGIYKTRLEAGGSHSKEEDCQRVMLGFDYGLGVLLGHREAIDLLDKLILGKLIFLRIVKVVYSFSAT